LSRPQSAWRLANAAANTGSAADDLLPGQGDKPAGISVADLAVAIVDEIETPRHVRQRFTVAN
jgi:putative NADH-flavin reductase